MSELEKQLLEAKIAQIQLLSDQLRTITNSKEKPAEVPDDKPTPYYDAMIDFLKRQVQNAKLATPKLVSQDKTDQERANLSPAELEKLKEQQGRINGQADSYLSTLEPRASLKANIHTPDSIIIRYRGKGIDRDFAEKYPFGILL